MCVLVHQTLTSKANNCLYYYFLFGKFKVSLFPGNSTGGQSALLKLLVMRGDNKVSILSLIKNIYIYSYFYVLLSYMPAIPYWEKKYWDWGRGGEGMRGVGTCVTLVFLPCSYCSLQASWVPGTTFHLILTESWQILGQGLCQYRIFTVFPLWIH